MALSDYLNGPTHRRRARADDKRQRGTRAPGDPVAGRSRRRLPRKRTGDDSGGLHNWEVHDFRLFSRSNLLIRPRLALLIRLALPRLLNSKH